MDRYELDLQLGSSATIKEILAASTSFSRDANGEDEVNIFGMRALVMPTF